MWWDVSILFASILLLICEPLSFFSFFYYFTWLLVKMILEPISIPIRFL